MRLLKKASCFRGRAEPSRAEPSHAPTITLGGTHGQVTAPPPPLPPLPPPLPLHPTAGRVMTTGRRQAGAVVSATPKAATAGGARICATRLPCKWTQPWLPRRNILVRRRRGHLPGPRGVSHAVYSPQGGSGKAPATATESLAWQSEGRTLAADVIDFVI